MIDAALHPDSGPRFVSGENLEAGYRSIHTAFSDLRTDVLWECDRCKFYGRRSFDWETGFRLVGIAAPPSIVLFMVCVGCQLELAVDYPDTHWGVEGNGSL